MKDARNTTKTKTRFPIKATLELPSDHPIQLMNYLVRQSSARSIESSSNEKEANISFPHAHVLFECDSRKLNMQLSASNNNAFYNIREIIVREVSHLPSPLKTNVIWKTNAPKIGKQPENFRLGTIQKKRLVFDGLLRLTATLDQPLGPGGFHFKLLLPPRGQQKPNWPSLRTDGATSWPEGSEALHRKYYTVRTTRDEGLTIDIDIVCHDKGRVSDWAKVSEAGDVFGMLGPSGFDAELFKASHDNDTSGRDIIIAGDMTALPVIARILEINHTASLKAWVACPSQKDADDYFGSGKVKAIPPNFFDASIEDILRRERPPWRAWFAGEFETAQRLRNLFKDKWGLLKRQQLSVAYWRKKSDVAAKSRVRKSN